MFRSRRIRLAMLVVALGLASGSRAGAGEFYYVMIFGSQGSPKFLRYTHTFATFIKATGEGPDPANYAVEAHTISWLPATGVVRVLSPLPERGVNFDLDQTLAYVTSKRETVTVWGPFRIGKILWDRSLELRAIVHSGKPRYRAISNARDMLISDCIHAVAAVDPQFGRGHYPLIRIGKPASRYIARQIMTRSRFDQSQDDNAWLLPRFGLERYGVVVVPPSRIPKKNCLLCLTGP